MKRQAAIFMLFLLSISANAQADSTFKQMKTDVARGNWEVIWSESYGFEKAALLAACVYVGCAQSYLGHELDSLKSRAGDQLLEQALRNKGKVIVGPGELKIQAGTAYWSTYYNVWNPLRNRNEKVTTARYVRLYIKYRRDSSPPDSAEAKSIYNPWLKKYLGVHENGQIVMWPQNTGTGERWQLNSDGCIYNPWLKKYLGVHETGEIVMWPRCSTGEQWQVKSDGCIFNPFLKKYLGVHETGEIVMWPQCSTGEKWAIR